MALPLKVTAYGNLTSFKVLVFFFQLSSISVSNKAILPILLAKKGHKTILRLDAAITFPLNTRLLNFVCLPRITVDVAQEMLLL